jgi:hypothetical protein
VIIRQDQGYSGVPILPLSSTLPFGKVPATPLAVAEAQVPG